VGRRFDNSDPAFQERRIAGIRKAMQDPIKRAHKKKIAVENIVRYMDERPEHFKEAVAGNGQRGKKYLEAHGYNHKVIAIEHLTERSDVYCLQVEKYHNFALAAGVFVHNCGMGAIKTRFTRDDLAKRDRLVWEDIKDAGKTSLAQLREAIEDAIPVSMGNYNSNKKRFPFTHAKHEELIQLATRDAVDLSHSPKWMEQLGSLGGGNHFIELCVDSDDTVWLFLHSGSRGVGNKIAQRHIKIAETQCKENGVSLPNRELAYLTEGTPEFDRYIKDLNWAQRFAYLNREEMLDRFKWAFARWLGVEMQRVEVDRVVCHHNYTTKTEIDGETVWLTRKGAIDASEGKLGLIPGSMGTRSYVVRGKGLPTSHSSAPHGAGRKFSRTQAKKNFTEADLEAAMEGIEYRHGPQWIDEIPGAYKPIETIMDDATDLVEVVTELRQLLNVKGT
jgi:tRNA-splicing ligase RtcB